MLELRVKQGRRHVPVFDLPATLGHAKAYREIGSTVEGLIAFLDDMGGDPDLEDGGDEEEEERGDQAWIEWQSLHASKRSGPNVTLGEEDDELVGDETDGVGAEDEVCAWFAHLGSGPGCIASDSDFCSAGEDCGTRANWS